MKIASFNVQRFGLKKVSDPLILSTLVKIVSRYDLILILEVTDVSGESVDIFLRELNAVNTEHHYSLKISSRLGRTRYKEQFLFLYRDDVMNLVDSYQYEDNQAGDHDAFAREPYILRFMCFNTVLKDLVLIPVHTKPEDTLKELDELYEVFLAVQKRWSTDNIMILGDFNADGAYMSGTDFHNIRIRNDKNFHWLIGDDVDTTANTGNEHTYDRIVVYGQDMLEAVVPDSACPFNFHTAFNLTEEMALRVSDHYPVEVELRWASKPIGFTVLPRSPMPYHSALQPRGPAGACEPISASPLPSFDSLPQLDRAFYSPESHEMSYSSAFEKNQTQGPRSGARCLSLPVYGSAALNASATSGPGQQTYSAARHDLPEALQGGVVLQFPETVQCQMVEVLQLHKDKLHLEKEKLSLEIEILKRELARDNS